MINDGNLVLAFAIICSLSVTRIYLVVKVAIKFITFRLSPILPKLRSSPFTIDKSPHLSRPTSKTWPTRQFTSGFERLFLSQHLLFLPILWFSLHFGWICWKKRWNFIIVPTSADQLPKPCPRDRLHLGSSGSICPGICCACLRHHLHPLSRLVRKYLAKEISDHRQ